MKNRKDNWCSLSPLHDEESFKEIRTKESILVICCSVFISYKIKGLLPIHIKRVEARTI